MNCKCEIIEYQNNHWVAAFDECLDASEKHGPFHSKYEVEAYLQQYFPAHKIEKVYLDFEHPDNKKTLQKYREPMFKYRHWDFEDYKILAWRNAGFRSRK